MPAIREVTADAVAVTDVNALRACANNVETEALRDLLIGLADSVEHGTDVALTPIEDDLTTQQAADWLKMSRAHLYKLLDKGSVPSHYVGSHRRIAMRDLLDFAKRRDVERGMLAEMFANADANRRAAIAELADDM
ncbi:hypothetical protein RE9416_49070 (plasmid) [Prescottella equi]|nr:hypothetical protein RE9416_49070 [Prescottella equi]BCN56626.1 hypothetical protein RE9425_50160 [Prescottella equi]BCN61541.1 hypothetical protein RE9427_49110 [Prescottella equi]BCN86344.1 hypothetical protein RE0356_49850 [Prescottella equi]